MDVSKYFGGPMNPSANDDIDPVIGRQFLTTSELAVRWRKSQRTLENMRTNNKGISYYKINGSVRYDLLDVIEYELQNFFKGVVTNGWFKKTSTHKRRG